MAKHPPHVPQIPLQGEQPQPGPAGSVLQQGKRLPMRFPNHSRGAERGGPALPPSPSPSWMLTRETAQSCVTA